MTIQAKLLVRRGGFAAFALLPLAGAGADRAGMQRQVPGRQEGRLARHPEVERLPQGAVRRRRDAGAALLHRLARPKRRREGGQEGSGACAAPAAPAGPAVFPNAVDPKYSKESEGKARMHTCVDQYNANKTGNANGGLKWIQKGGGYYSECTKKLKGAAA